MLTFRLANVRGQAQKGYSGESTYDVTGALSGKAGRQNQRGVSGRQSRRVRQVFRHPYGESPSNWPYAQLYS
jgi:hypothetical protein